MQRPLAPEDEARAEFYAVLSRLFAGPPDAPLLAAIAASQPWPDEADNPLAAAWNRLILASRAMDAEAAEQEYTDLFVGVGKSEVDLHAAHWLPANQMEKPLASLRTDLAALGLSRQPRVTTYENNLASLLETMRILVAGRDARPPVPVAAQRVFFERHIAPWSDVCCNAICESSFANYYRRVAQCCNVFLAIERDSFAVD